MRSKAKRKQIFAFPSHNPQPVQYHPTLVPLNSSSSKTGTPRGTCNFSITPAGSYLFAHFVYAAIFKRAEPPSCGRFSAAVIFTDRLAKAVPSLCVRENTRKAPLGIGPEDRSSGPPSVSFRSNLVESLLRHWTS